MRSPNRACARTQHCQPAQDSFPSGCDWPICHCSRELFPPVIFFGPYCLKRGNGLFKHWQTHAGTRHLCHALRPEGCTLQLTVPVLPVLLALEDLVCHTCAALLGSVVSAAGLTLTEQESTGVLWLSAVMQAGSVYFPRSYQPFKFFLTPFLSFSSSFCSFIGKNI